LRANAGCRGAGSARRRGAGDCRRGIFLGWTKGTSSTFDDAIGEFATEYADQNERDYRRFAVVVKEGRIAATADI
jgi:hypothetical protein